MAKQLTWGEVNRIFRDSDAEMLNELRDSFKWRLPDGTVTRSLKGRDNNMASGAVSKIAHLLQQGVLVAESENDDAEIVEDYMIATLRVAKHNYRCLVVKGIVYWHTRDVSDITGVHYKDLGSPIQVASDLVAHRLDSLRTHLIATHTLLDSKHKSVRQIGQLLMPHAERIAYMRRDAYADDTPSNGTPSAPVEVIAPEPEPELTPELKILRGFELLEEAFNEVQGGMPPGEVEKLKEKLTEAQGQVEKLEEERQGHVLIEAAELDRLRELERVAALLKNAL